MMIKLIYLVFLLISSSLTYITVRLMVKNTNSRLVKDYYLQETKDFIASKEFDSVWPRLDLLKNRPPNPALIPKNTVIKTVTNKHPVKKSTQIKLDTVIEPKKIVPKVEPEPVKLDTIKFKSKPKITKVK